MENVVWYSEKKTLIHYNIFICLVDKINIKEIFLQIGRFCDAKRLFNIYLGFYLRFGVKTFDAIILREKYKRFWGFLVE